MAPRRALTRRGPEGAAADRPAWTTAGARRTLRPCAPGGWVQGSRCSRRRHAPRRPRPGRPVARGARRRVAAGLRARGRRRRDPDGRDGGGQRRRRAARPDPHPRQPARARPRRPASTCRSSSSTARTAASSATRPTIPSTSTSCRRSACARRRGARAARRRTCCGREGRPAGRPGRPLRAARLRRGPGRGDRVRRLRRLPDDRRPRRGGVHAGRDRLAQRASPRASTSPGGRSRAAWATGAVGMIGVSYDGTLANMVATTGARGTGDDRPDQRDLQLVRLLPRQRARGGAALRDAGRRARTPISARTPTCSRGSPAGNERTAGRCAHVLRHLIERQDRVTGDENAFWRERDYLRAAGRDAARACSSSTG